MKVFENLLDRTPAEFGEESIARFTVDGKEIDVTTRDGFLEIRGREGGLNLSLHSSNVLYVQVHD